MKPLRVAIAGFTACSGCQLTLLNCEAELPLLLPRFQFCYFPLACSPAELEGAYDVALIEGCLSTTGEIEFIQELRQRSKLLIALGACAASGGIPALANCSEREELWQQVYGTALLPSGGIVPQPLHTAVTVDATIPGCPPEKEELLKLLAGLLQGVLPVAVDAPVCSECRMAENLCLLMERGELCLGPLTRGGCNARCPSLGVACEGCRGAVPEANLAEALQQYQNKGYDRQTVLARLHRFCPEWKS